jgi:hypothetical protein
LRQDEDVVKIWAGARSEWEMLKSITGKSGDVEVAAAKKACYYQECWCKFRVIMDLKES